MRHSFFHFGNDYNTEEVEISMSCVQRNYQMRREDSYISRASERLIATTTRGGISAKLGGVIPISSFTEDMENAWIDNARHAMEWFLCAGFVPIEIRQRRPEEKRLPENGEDNDTTTTTNKVGVVEEEDTDDRSAVGESDDSNDKLAKSYNLLGPSDVEMAYRGRHGYSEDVPPEIEENNVLNYGSTTIFGDNTLETAPGLDTEDFDFSVPSVGYGSYVVYRDPETNRRRMYKKYDEELERRRRRDREKERRRREDQINKNLPRSNQAWRGPDEDLREVESKWYIFMLEEPFDDGRPSCSMTRIVDDYERYLYALEQERTGIHLANSPLAFIEHQDPAKYMGNRDRHMSYVSEEEAVRIHTEKSRRGRPRHVEDALNNATTHFRNVVTHAGFDMDQLEQQYWQSQQSAGGSNGGSQHMSGGGRTHALPHTRKHGATLKPTKLVTASEYHNMFINSIVVEFGIPAQDFKSEDRSRFKQDRVQQIPALIDRVRDFRNRLSEMMQEIFVQKNAEVLPGTLGRIAETLDIERIHLNDAVERLMQISGDVRQRLFEDGIIPSPGTGQPQENRGIYEQDQRQPVSPEISQVSDVKDDTNEMTATDNSTTPDESGKTIDEDAMHTLNWIKYVERTYDAIARAQEFINKILNNSRPLTVNWKQPIIPDANSISNISKMIGLDERQEQELASSYLGS